MSNPYAVRVDQIAKSYTIAHEYRATTLGEAISRRVSQPLKKHTKEEFWALRDVSFDVKKGEVIGIIGRNGAGKSTLLKILSRIVSPTRGQIEMHGHVGSLLEVGTGFHPELTGRENIYLNGSILGMRRREIERHFDAIVDFAGVERFLDTPVKRYSSGMYVRLAFAVAAHLRSDILIIDEVLAVGDAEFQKKCLGKMQSIASGEGRTILFVSHNMTSVRTLCQRCVLLSQGEVDFDGDCEEATMHYLAQLKGEAANSSGELTGAPDLIHGEFDLKVHDNPYSKETLIQKILLRNDKGALTNQVKMGHSLSVEVMVYCPEPFLHLGMSLFFKNKDGITLTSAGTHLLPPRSTPQRSRNQRFYFEIPQIPFVPGSYEIEFLLRRAADNYTIKLDRVQGLVYLNVEPADVLKSGYEFSKNDGQVYLQSSWDSEPLPLS